MTIQYKNGGILFGTGKFKTVKVLCPEGESLRQIFQRAPAGVKLGLTARTYFKHKNSCRTCRFGEYETIEVMEAITLCETGIQLYLTKSCLIDEGADKDTIREASATYHQHRNECEKCSKPATP